MEEKKPGSREQVKQIVAQIENGIQELFQSEKYADYLRTMSRFHTYSYNNQLLIHMQMPHATRVAGFNKWKNQFGRHVKKGEKGLTIIAPAPFKKRIEEMKLDPDTKAPMTDLDGNVIMEEKEIEIPLFRPVKVFDVSQTEGAPLPSLVSDLAGNVEHYEAFVEALRHTSPVPILFSPIEENMDGFFSPKDQSITIREGMSQVQTVCAAVHEITHAMLHNRNQEEIAAAAVDEAKEPPKPKDRNTEEVEAESVSYAVCQYFGIETSANSLGYIATWSKDRSLPELKASLETISKTANILIASIDRHFKEICKERGIELTQPEQAVPEVETVSESPLETQPEELVPAEDTTLDEYPMPEPGLTVSELEQQYGYMNGDLLPLSHERAAELFDRELSIYAIVDGGEAELILDQDDIEARPFDSIFAIPRDEWEVSPDFRQTVAERMERQEERERAFLGHAGDCFAIYQLRRDETLRGLRYEPLERIRKAGQSPMRANYELVYTSEIPPGQGLAVLDTLWERFNTDHPPDYRHPSMSVSDIVALKQDGVVSCHYVDRLSFTALPGFFQNQPLKSAETVKEDSGPKPSVADFEAQVKAGQSISLMDLVEATHRERKKKSVVAQLKGQPQNQERKKTAPKRSAEREV